MISFTTYSNMIIALNKNGEININDYFDSPLFLSLIYIMKDLSEKYKETISGIEIKNISEESIEYFFYLEGRIRYLLLTDRKEVITKKQNDLSNEFQELCRKAIGKYEYSFNASIGLAELQFVRKNYSESVNLISNLYNFGYKSDGILDLLISYTIGSKDWDTYKKYLEHIESNIFRRFLKISYFVSRYTLLRIPYIFSYFLIGPLLGWKISLILILTIDFLLILMMIIIRKRTSFMFGTTYLLVSLIAIFFWIIYKI